MCLLEISLVPRDEEISGTSIIPGASAGGWGEIDVTAETLSWEDGSFSKVAVFFRIVEGSGAFGYGSGGVGIVSFQSSYPFLVK